MRKSIKKISLIAAAFLCTSLFGYIHHFVRTFKVYSHHHVRNIPLNGKTFSRYFALETHENLNCYHCGLKQLFSDYTPPSAADLLHSIRSHPQYRGFITHDTNLSTPEESSTYFLYEEILNNEPHFYLSHANGIRHFTVSQSSPNASLRNGTLKKYPYLNHFIHCTISLS